VDATLAGHRGSARDPRGRLLDEHSGYRAALTEAGRLFLERTEGLPSSADALRRFGLALGGAAEPVVRLVVEAITPLPRIIAALREVRSRFPAALDVREFEVRAIELFTVHRRDEPIGPVSQALWTCLQSSSLCMWARASEDLAAGHRDELTLERSRVTLPDRVQLARRRIALVVVRYACSGRTRTRSCERGIGRHRGAPATLRQCTGV
jgi:hypothetical protein